eukprot:jgi/Botrbrau1/1328/Bobra.0063s0042.1
MLAAICTASVLDVMQAAVLRIEDAAAYATHHHPNALGPRPHPKTAPQVPTLGSARADCIGPVPLPSHPSRPHPPAAPPFRRPQDPPLRWGQTTPALLSSTSQDFQDVLWGPGRPFAAFAEHTSHYPQPPSSQRSASGDRRPSQAPSRASHQPQQGQVPQGTASGHPGPLLAGPLPSQTLRFRADPGCSCLSQPSQGPAAPRFARTGGLGSSQASPNDPMLAWDTDPPNPCAGTASAYPSPGLPPCIPQAGPAVPREPADAVVFCSGSTCRTEGPGFSEPSLEDPACSPRETSGFTPSGNGYIFRNGNTRPGGGAAGAPSTGAAREAGGAAGGMGGPGSAGRREDPHPPPWCVGAVVGTEIVLQAQSSLPVDVRALVNCLQGLRVGPTTLRAPLHALVAAGPSLRLGAARQEVMCIR